MKIRNLLFIFITLASTIISCKKDAEVCSFSAASLNGKSFKVSKIYVTQNGIKSDITDYLLAQSPCYKLTLQFFSTTVKQLLPSNCTDTTLRAKTVEIPYSVSTENSKKYLNLTDSDTNEISKMEVNAFDCSSFTCTATIETIKVDIIYAAL